MRSNFVRQLIASVLLVSAGCARVSEGPEKRPPKDAERGRAGGQAVSRLSAAVDALKGLHRPLGEPLPGDWLTHFQEPGQTFAEYLRGNPTLPSERRRVLYVQPLGAFTDAQRKVIALTAVYMESFFNLPVKLEPEKPLPAIPENARRVHRAWGDRQILTGFLLNNVLRPGLPEDAHALIGFTASDLYPDEDSNFVFGQASMSERVGVWSLYRLGEPERSAGDFRLFLRRTLKIATHETGHMFAIGHCTKYECNMNGSNHLEEMDGQPLAACPECMAKICWATDYNPRVRYERLAAFCREHGLTQEREFFERAAKTLEGLYPI
jgi:archaemetzincin